jgi:thioredoxin 1
VPASQVEWQAHRRYGSLTMEKFRMGYFSVFAYLALAIASTGPQAAVHDIYPAPAQASADIAAAIKTGAAAHKRVILDFGGNWCPDCYVLDSYFHDAANKPLLDASFILVHVNVGRLDANLDIAQRYQIPLNKGVPAVAVLDETGKLLFSQKTGEFEAMRHMQSQAVTDFLVLWKDAAS